MTSTIAFIGKSSSGKTTLAKAFSRLIHKNFPDSTILIVDNDLTLELSDSFGVKTKNTLYGVKSGKHEYKTGIPEGMSKQEYIEWALEDIIIEIDENIDLVASWFVTPKDCKCPNTKLMRDSLSKFISRYDFVIFDCEFDLKYLNQLVDTNIDLTLLIANPSIESVLLAKRISEYSAKYAVGGQMGVIINKIGNDNIEDIYALAKESDMEILGSIPYDSSLSKGSITRESQLVKEAIENLYYRLNLPQENK